MAVKPKKPARGDWLSQRIYRAALRAQRIAAAARSGRLSLRGAEKRLASLSAEGWMLWRIRQRIVEEVLRLRVTETARSG